MKIAALYARVSGERQRDDNTIASRRYCQMFSTGLKNRITLGMPHETGRPQ